MVDHMVDCMVDHKATSEERDFIEKIKAVIFLKLVLVIEVV